MDSTTKEIMDTMEADSAFNRTVENGVSSATSAIGDIDLSVITNSTLEDDIQSFISGFPASFGPTNANLDTFTAHAASQLTDIADKLTVMTSSKCATSSLGLPSLGSTRDFFGSVMDIGDTFKVELSGLVNDLVTKATNFISQTGAFNVRLGEVRDLMTGNLDSLIANELDATRVLTLQALRDEISSDFANSQELARTDLFTRYLAEDPDSVVSAAKSELETEVLNIAAARDEISTVRSSIQTHTVAGVDLVNTEKDLADRAYAVMLKASDANTLRSLATDPEVSTLLGYVATDDMLKLLGRR